MATVFWDTQGVILTDILSKGSTITGAYYANLLDQPRNAIREKRRGKLSKGVLLQHDNAMVYTCKVAMDAVERNGYEGRHFVMVPLNMTYLHCLQHSLFEHLFNLYMNYELIPHPPYSPDLAPSDFFLFPNLKKGYTWTSFPV